ALEQQNATAEILSSIGGSMSDTRPVFEAILRNLLRLFGTRFAFVALLRDDMIDIGGMKGDAGFEKVARSYPLPLDDKTLVGRAMLSREANQLAPIAGNPEAPVATEKFARDFGFNSQISAPMVREGKVIGAISTAHRDAVAFNEKQIAL